MFQTKFLNLFCCAITILCSYYGLCEKVTNKTQGSCRYFEIVKVNYGILRNCITNIPVALIKEDLARKII